MAGRVWVVGALTGTGRCRYTIATAHRRVRAEFYSGLFIVTAVDALLMLVVYADPMQPEDPKALAPKPLRARSFTQNRCLTPRRMLLGLVLFFVFATMASWWYMLASFQKEAAKS